LRVQSSNTGRILDCSAALRDPTSPCATLWLLNRFWILDSDRISAQI
jgi:hypothetical protein